MLKTVFLNIICSIFLRQNSQYKCLGVFILCAKASASQGVHWNNSFFKIIIAQSWKCQPPSPSLFFLEKALREYHFLRRGFFRDSLRQHSFSKKSRNAVSKNSSLTPEDKPVKTFQRTVCISNFSLGGLIGKSS